MNENFKPTVDASSHLQLCSCLCLVLYVLRFFWIKNNWTQQRTFLRQPTNEPADNYLFLYETRWPTETTSKRLESFPLTIFCPHCNNARTEVESMFCYLFFYSLQCSLLHGIKSSERAVAEVMSLCSTSVRYFLTCFTWRCAGFSNFQKKKESLSSWLIVHNYDDDGDGELKKKSGV